MPSFFMAPATFIQALLVAAIPVFAASATRTELPSPTSTSVYKPSGQATLSKISYSFTYTVTTATTSWTAPTFPAGIPSSPFPACSETMCPALNNQRCVDSLGDVYGVLCDIRFGGIVITTSGKKMRMMMEKRLAGEDGTKDVDDEPELLESDIEPSLEQRSYAGSFDSCGMFCGAYNRTLCRGVGYEGGYCMAYDKITGSFNAPGAIAALRQ